MLKKFNLGITFLELLVVITITGILAAVAIPSYTQTLRENRRQDGIQALRSGKSAIEQYLLNNQTLPTSLAIVGVSNTSAKGYYTISFTPGTGTAYTLTATAIPAGPQSDDTGCTSIRLSNLYDDTQPASCK